MSEPTRRWDVDERGAGIASGEPFARELERLRAEMRRSDWITEDADAHLLPHIRRACEAGGRFRVVGDEQQPDGVYLVRLAAEGDDRLREALFSVLGSFAEPSTHVRERRTGDAVEFDVVTGVLPGDSQFRTHGHLVRFRVEGVSDLRAAY